MEKYRIQVARRFEKDFRTLDWEMKRRADSIIRRLEAEPFIGKPLRGELKGKRSLRIGNYRIIYVIDEKNRIITLLTIRPRRTAYR
ncbi:MAG: type II toxin-antitoxin system mRNA interferase toxin, RelE/StbE family [Candidatus Wolframiiraptor sp.]|nr:MAG: type II toxin-antitoxin system mRNA interferase toxin, RelE/StbE family [Candidatus Wolframiiraptor sp.]